MKTGKIKEKDKSKEQKIIAEAKAKRDELDKQGYYTLVPGYLPKTEIFVKFDEDKQEVIKRFRRES